MLKRTIVLLLLLSMVVTLFGCGEKEPDLSVDCECTPPPLYFGFGMEIQFVNFDKYIKFESFEICDAYENLEPLENGSGYYVILGVSTNLPESDFSSGKGGPGICLSTDATTHFELFLRLFDADEAKMVLEIQQKSDADYAKLMTLKIEDQPVAARFDFWPCISFAANKYYYEYLSAEGMQHYGKEFRGQLEWGA